MPATTVFKRLRVFNVVMGTLHLAQAVALLVLSNNYKISGRRHSFLTVQPRNACMADIFRGARSKVRLTSNAR